MIICDLLLKGFKIKPYLSGVKIWMWTWALFENWFSDNCGVYVWYRKNTEIDDEVIRNNTSIDHGLERWTSAWLLSGLSGDQVQFPAPVLGSSKSPVTPVPWDLISEHFRLFGGTPLPPNTHTTQRDLKTHSSGWVRSSVVEQCWHMTPDLISSSAGRRRNNCTYHACIFTEWHPSFVMLNFLTLENEQWFPPSGELSRIKWHHKCMQIFTSP